MQQAEEADDESAGFHFDALVRGLCSSTSMQAHLQDVRRQALLKRQDARATLDIALETLANPKASVEEVPITRFVSECRRLTVVCTNLMVFVACLVEWCQ